VRVLVACEFSGVVRRAFRALGHDAWSCDLLPAEDGSPRHFTEDVRGPLQRLHWDLLIAHPPCRFLSCSGARWWKKRRTEQHSAIRFVFELAKANVSMIAIENPQGILSTVWRQPDQWIEPWQHGHGETKRTGLWLKNLPKLKPSKIVTGRASRIHRMPQSKDRSKERSRTYDGIGMAMAWQWGGLVPGFAEKRI
jgi:site-specific DNA-cytosine methylase